MLNIRCSTQRHHNIRTSKITQQLVYLYASYPERAIIPQRHHHQSFKTPWTSRQLAPVRWRARYWPKGESRELALRCTTGAAAVATYIGSAQPHFAVKRTHARGAARRCRPRREKVNRKATLTRTAGGRPRAHAELLIFARARAYI